MGNAIAGDLINKSILMPDPILFILYMKPRDIVSVRENGAGARDRTGMDLVSPRDFKSLASANSATPARSRSEGVTIAPGQEGVKLAW